MAVSSSLIVLNSFTQEVRAGVELLRTKVSGSRHMLGQPFSIASIDPPLAADLPGCDPIAAERARMTQQLIFRCRVCAVGKHRIVPPSSPSRRDQRTNGAG